MDEDVTEEDKHGGRIGLWSKKLIIEEGVELKAPKVILFANDTIDIKKDVVINSAIDNECYMDVDGNKDLYECMNFDEHPEKITFEYLIDYYNRQFNLQHGHNNRFFATRPRDMTTKLQD